MQKLKGKKPPAHTAYVLAEHVSGHYGIEHELPRFIKRVSDRALPKELRGREIYRVPMLEPKIHEEPAEERVHNRSIFVEDRHGRIFEIKGVGLRQLNARPLPAGGPAGIERSTKGRIMRREKTGGFLTLFDTGNYKLLGAMYELKMMSTIDNSQRLEAGLREAKQTNDPVAIEALKHGADERPIMWPVFAFRPLQTLIRVTRPNDFIRQYGTLLGKNELRKVQSRGKGVYKLSRGLELITDKGLAKDTLIFGHETGSNIRVIDMPDNMFGKSSPEERSEIGKRFVANLALNTHIAVNKLGVHLGEADRGGGSAMSEKDVDVRGWLNDLDTLEPIRAPAQRERTIGYARDLIKKFCAKAGLDPNKHIELFDRILSKAE